MRFRIFGRAASIAVLACLFGWCGALKKELVVLYMHVSQAYSFLTDHIQYRAIFVL